MLDRSGLPKRLAFERQGEKIETGSVSGKLQCHVSEALAGFERNLIRERTLAAGLGCTMQPPCARLLEGVTPCNPLARVCLRGLYRTTPCALVAGVSP
jgi:hypothetical protein